MSSKPPTSIQSAAFPGVFLRMDGSGVTAPTGPGGGTVNCQFGAGPWEQFDLAALGNSVFNLQSNAFPGVFLRMDGSGVTAPTGPGGGTVNCQFGAGPWEAFRFELQPDNTTALASVAFPGVYLRMDGAGVTSPTGPGGGTVNGQFGVGAWEKFYLHGVEIMQFTGQNLMACTCLTAMHGCAGQATSEITVLAGAPSLLAGICGCDPNNVVLPPEGVGFTVTGPDGTVYSSVSPTTNAVNIGVLNGELVTLSVIDPMPGVWSITVDSTAASAPWRVMLQSMPQQQTVATWAAAAQAQFPSTPTMLFAHERALMASVSHQALHASWYACLGCKVFSYSLAVAIFILSGVVLGPETAIVVQLVRVSGWTAETAIAFITGVGGYSLGEIVGAICTGIDACS